MSSNNNIAYKFLSLFSSSEDEEFHFRTFPEQKGGGYAKNFVHKLDELNKDISKWSSQAIKRDGTPEKYPTHYKSYNEKKKHGFYFVVNFGGSTDDKIKKIRAFYIDVDFAKEKHSVNSEGEAQKLAGELKETGRYKKVQVNRTKSGNHFVTARFTKKEVLLAKNEFLDKHSEAFKDALIVETYSGFHIYWLVSNCSISLFAKIEEYLIFKFKSDPQVKNLSRVLRVPEFVHQKYEEPFQIRVLQWTERRFTVDEFTSELNVNFQWVEEQKKKEKVLQTKGYGKKSFKEVIDHTGLERTVTETEFKGKNADIEFVYPKPTVKKVTFSEAIQEIKSRPISDFVSKPDMSINPGESKTRVCCPFHNDTNPSAEVFTSKRHQQVFYCHSCQVGTKDAIGLYMIKTHSSFRNTVKRLAAMIGIKVVKTEWEQDLKEIYDDNREFLEQDLELMYPNLYYYISQYGRITYLRYLNDKGSVNILSEEFSYEEKNVYFASMSFIKKELNKKSVKTVHRTVCLLLLLGFFKRVPEEFIPERFRKNAEIKRLDIKLELKEQGPLGEKRAEFVRNINFYIVQNWADLAFEIEQMAFLLREKGFSLNKHMNKIGLTKLMGEEIANRVFQDDRRVNQKFDRLEEKIKEIVDTEISEVGYCRVDDVLSRQIRYQITESDGKKKIKKATFKEKEDVITRSLSTILEDKYIVKTVQSKEKKKLFGYTKNDTKKIKVILNK
ncbi:hypothetical protein HNP21_006280 [Bacillus aryabhattai]|uniref:Zinc finger CHC2-type domain-containing protein n=1 Tax=Priestia aryabhattai TaxID=412384 RepID=A0A7W3NHJ0_PRIAR|nr:CHC2 zinc finger domain-containing protein [Priestia aryabhattai]MBA9043102.1 hypothetical protein [Priestia aryabhattai]